MLRSRSRLTAPVAAPVAAHCPWSCHCHLPLSLSLNPGTETETQTGTGQWRESKP